MFKTKKHTSWKKNRKLGDIWGGRLRNKMEDNIFKRFHSFAKPSIFEEVPIILKENPSKNFFFPISIDDIHQTFLTEKYTHIWFRKVKQKDYELGKVDISEHITGSGVKLLIIYAFSKDLKLRYGFTKSQNRRKHLLEKFDAILKQDILGYYFQFTELNLKKYYLEFGIQF